MEFDAEITCRNVSFKYKDTRGDSHEGTILVAKAQLPIYYAILEERDRLRQELASCVEATSLVRMVGESPANVVERRLQQDQKKIERLEGELETLGANATKRINELQSEVEMLEANCQGYLAHIAEISDDRGD
jgi:hypothetical protein